MDKLTVVPKVGSEFLELSIAVVLLQDSCSRNVSTNSWGIAKKLFTMEKIDRAGIHWVWVRRTYGDIMTTTADITSAVVTAALVDADPTAHPMYQEFVRFAAEVLTPRAVEVDRTEVPRSHIDGLREIGYHRLFVPEQYGGLKLPPRVVNAVNNLLFGVDPSTATIVTQHGAPVLPAVTAGTDDALELLPKLASGELIGGAGWGMCGAGRNAAAPPSPPASPADIASTG